MVRAAHRPVTAADHGQLVACDEESMTGITKIEDQAEFVEWWDANVSVHQHKRGKGKHGKNH
jgi:hypothetical protein